MRKSLFTLHYLCHISIILYYLYHGESFADDNFLILFKLQLSTLIILPPDFKNKAFDLNYSISIKYYKI